MTYLMNKTEMSKLRSKATTNPLDSDLDVFEDIKASFKDVAKAQKNANEFTVTFPFFGAEIQARCDGENTRFKVAP